MNTRTKLTLRKHVKVADGWDRISEKVMGSSYKIPSVHKTLCESGASKLICTGHYKTLRVDLSGVWLSVPDEEAEVSLLSSLKHFKVEVVMVIQRDTGVSVLFDFISTKPHKEGEPQEFLEEVKRLVYAMDKRTRVKLPTPREAVLVTCSPLEGNYLGRARPGLSAYEGSLHE